MIQQKIANDLDSLIKKKKNIGLKSRTDGIEFLLEEYKKNLKENA
tara:strand:+ start:674 stop:808 length:135 start_codon:yes stop_codon:yes gene_type:complete